MLGSAQLGDWLGLISGSSRGLIRGSRFGIWLAWAQCSVPLTWVGVRLTSSRLCLSRITNIFLIKKTMHRREKCETQIARRANDYKTADEKNGRYVNENPLN